MPILKNAKKKLRQERKRELHNQALTTGFKNLLKKARKAKTAESVSKAVSAVDKAAKKNLIHKNKAAHIKSDLSKLTAGGSTPAASTDKKTETKKAPVKKAAPAKKAVTKKASPKKSTKK